MTLTVRGVGFRAGSTQIIDGVDLTVPAGEVLGVLGPNGAGKSTLLHLIAGTLRPQAGSITLFDTDLVTLRRRERARRVALVEQDATTDLPMTVQDVTLLGRTPHRSLFSGDSDFDRQTALDALQAVGMASFVDRAFDTLSGGERQRVQLARALVQDPQLLLLDEPTNHLDIHAQLSVLTLVRTLADAGMTTVAALHDLNLAVTYCDRLVVLLGGRVVAQGPARELLTPELVRRVYNVDAEVLTHPATGRPVIMFA